jgi:hypothetical protein
VFPEGAGTPSSTLPPPTTSGTSLNSLSAYPAMSQPQRPAPAYPAQIPSKMGGQNSGSTGLNPYPTLPSTSSGSTYSNIQSGESSSNSKSTSPIPFTSQSNIQNNQIASTSLIASSNYQNIPPYQPSYDSPSPSHQFNPNLNSNTYSNTNLNSKEYQYQKHADLGSKNPSENDLNVHTLPLPEIPSEFREIRNLTTFQLEKLSKDEVAIQVNERLFICFKFVN